MSEEPEDRDTAVQSTGDEAAASKLCAAQLGYVHDEFIECFVRKKEKRAPLINRGYYARVAAFDQAVEEFLELTSKSKPQIVSLGAGFDTTFFRLKSQNKHPSKYFEVDFPMSVNRKAMAIHKHRKLTELANFSEAKSDSGPRKDFVGTDYTLISADMRLINNLERKLTDCAIDFSAPTLFLAECVLVYMEPQHSQAILKWCAEKFTGGCFFVNYEQIHPEDPFGQIMLSNMEDRGCSLLGIRAYPNLKSQEERFSQLGWRKVRAWNMNDIYGHYLPKEEIKRVEKIELFDEFEEWRLILSHYCVVMAAIGTAAFPALLELGILHPKFDGLGSDTVSCSSSFSSSPSTSSSSGSRRSRERPKLGLAVAGAVTSDPNCPAAPRPESPPDNSRHRSHTVAPARHRDNDSDSQDS